MLGHYARAALRNFRRRPLNTAIKLLALTLGLACFLSAYVFADFLRRADAHWANAGRIYSIAQSIVPPGSSETNTLTGAAAPLAKHLRAEMPWLEAVARLGFRASVTVEGQAEQVVVRGADPELLQIFDLPILEGGAEALSRPHSAMVSQDLARRMFGGAEAAMGQTLRLEQTSQTEVTIGAVIGEIPTPSALGEPSGDFDMLITMDAADDLTVPYFSAPADSDAEVDMSAIRAAFRRSELDNWGFAFGEVFVLLPQDGAHDVAAFEEQLAALAQRRVPPEVGQAHFDAVSPQTLLGKRIDGQVLRSSMSDLTVGGLLYGFGALVLAVACFNFASLSASEAAIRGREVGLRKTIGAGRLQIVAQTLVETGMLACAALVLVLIALPLGINAVSGISDLGVSLPPLSRLGFWAGLVAILAAVSILAGAYPSFILGSVRPHTAHRSASLAGAGARIRAVLSGAQFAVAAALLTGVFVIAMQNAELRRTGLGVQEDPLVLASFAGQVRSTNDLPELDLLRTELMADPAILEFTASSSGLFQPDISSPERIALSPAEDAESFAYAARAVYSEFFSVLDAPLVAGRDLREGDEDRVIIDAATAANLGLTPEGAVGRTLYHSTPIFRISSDGETSENRQVTELEIVGVAAGPALELQAAGSGNFVYRVSSRQRMTVLLRVSRQDVGGALDHIRQVHQALAPDQEVSVRFLDEQFDMAFQSYARISNVLIGLCALAVFIAAMGMFGMANFAVQRRVREVGVRKTLGARSGQVMALLLWDFSKPVIVAALIAWPVAWLAAQTYLNLFVTRIALTPTPFVASLAASLVVAWLAVGAQAWRAARVKPANVLSYE